MQSTGIVGALPREEKGHPRIMALENMTDCGERCDIWWRRTVFLQTTTFPRSYLAYLFNLIR